MKCAYRRAAFAVLAAVIPGIGVLNAPAGAGNLFVAGTVGEVYRGDSETGGFQPFGGICLGPVHDLAMDEGSIYAGDLNGGVVRFDLSTGDYMGIYFVPAGITSMAIDGIYLLTGAADGQIHRVRASTGEVVGSIQAFAPVEAMLLVGNDLYVTGPEGSVWIGTYGGGVARYQNERFEIVPDLEETIIFAFPIRGNVLLLHVSPT